MEHLVFPQVLKFYSHVHDLCIYEHAYVYKYTCSIISAPFVHACMQRSKPSTRFYSSDTIHGDYRHSVSHWPRIFLVGLVLWPKTLTNSLISAFPARSFIGNDKIWLFILLFGSNLSSHTFKAKHRLRYHIILPSSCYLK